jgi:U3 small nucleolar RNA-associated protein 14
MLHPHGVAVVLALALTPREGLAHLHHRAAEVRASPAQLVFHRGILFRQERPVERKGRRRSEDASALRKKRKMRRKPPAWAPPV